MDDKTEIYFAGQNISATYLSHFGKEDSDLDGLNYLAGKTMDYVNKNAAQGTVLAHVDGGVPNLSVELNQLSEYTFGEMVYFFEKACGIRGLLMGVNPFD
jgi:glucose-6-phosphate isomerase